MPIYEYQCSKCGHQLEAIQKMSDAPLINCPDCHESALTKLVSASGFQLKGTGWYVTDYSSKGKAKVTEASHSGAEEKPASKDTRDSSSDKSPIDSGASS